jgi:hypothetical protein
MGTQEEESGASEALDSCSEELGSSGGASRGHGGWMRVASRTRLRARACDVQTNVLHDWPHRIIGAIKAIQEGKEPLRPKHRPARVPHGVMRA